MTHHASHRVAVAFISALVPALALACGGGDGDGPPPDQPFGIVVVEHPGGAESGVLLTPRPIVELRNFTNERLVTDSTSTITVAIASGPAGGVLDGTRTVTISQGRATFADLAIRIAGTYTLVCSTNRGPWVVTSRTFTIVAGPLARFAILRHANGGLVNAAFSRQPLIELLDAAGNRRIADNVTPVGVVLSVDPTGGVATMTGQGTVVASAGVADWKTAATPLRLDTLAQGYRLRFTATPAAIDSEWFNIHGTPTRLAFVQQPGLASAGAPIVPPVRIEVFDAAGVRATGFDGGVRLRINDGPVRNVMIATGDGVQGETGVLEVADTQLPEVLGTVAGTVSAGVLAMTYDPGRNVIFAVDTLADLSWIDPTNGAQTRIGAINGLTPSPFGGGFPAASLKGLAMETPGGRLLGVEVGGDRLVAVDPKTAQPTVLGSITVAGGGATVRGFAGLARHPITDTLYAVAKLSTGGWASRIPGVRTLVRLDVATLRATVIGPIAVPGMPLPIAAIMFTPNGDCFGLADSGTVDLYRISISTGLATPWLEVTDNGFDTAGCTIPKPLGGITSAVALLGVATFGTVVIGDGGTGYSLRAFAPGVSDIVSDPFTVTP